MSIKSVAAKLFASTIYYQTKAWASKPVETQQTVFKSLIHSARETQFGEDHHFEKIKTVHDFRKRVPIRDYEDLKPYIDKVRMGRKIFFGKENRFILLKLRVQLREQSIFRLPKSQCLIILKLPEMQFCTIFMKPEMLILLMEK